LIFKPEPARKGENTDDGDLFRELQRLERRDRVVVQSDRRDAITLGRRILLCKRS
jgi:hypothetical protein